MYKIQQVAKVSNGKLILTKQQQDIISNNLRLLNNDSEVLVEISKYNDKKFKENIRTEQQNKYYHKLLDIICDYTGDEHLEMHRNLKCLFLSRPWVYEDKEYIEVRSTRDLTLKEFGDYLEKVFKFASEEYNLILPESKEYY